MSRCPASRRVADAGVFAAIALFLATPVSAQGPWTIAQVIGTLGGSTTSVRDINDAGQVVGSSQTAGGVSHAFIWTFAGGMVDLGTLGGNTSSASAINNLGQVVGSSATATGQNHAFLWSQTTGMVDLGAFGGTRSAAGDINDSGMVAINVTDAAGGTRAYRWTAATGLTNLGTLGGSTAPLASTFGAAINSSGWVAGSSPSSTACTVALPTCNGWPHAFLWKPTTGIADLGFLGSRFTEGNALGMNNAGQVVGYIEHAFAVSANAAFSWTPTSVMVRVSTLGGTENEAEDVNDSGLIVGTSFLVGDFFSHAFAGKIGTASVDLGTLGGTSSQASAVNSAGVIVGSALTATGVARAVVWYPAAPTVTTNPLDLGVTPGTLASFTATASGSPAPTVQWQVSTSGGPFSSIAGATSGTYAFVAVQADSGKKFRAVFTNSAGTATTNAATLSVNATLPTMTLDKTALIMSAVTTGTSLGARTSPQIVRLTQTGPGIVTWTAASTAPWLLVSPASGTGSATLRISPQFASGLTASQTASINLTFIGAGNTAGPITVTLTTFLSTQATAPVGSFDTPIDGSTGVAGSIAVTGWAIDDVEVTGVRILRDPVAGEPAGALVFIGSAVLVEGARPDIQAMFPNAPLNTRAGWGYLMLTNFLPNLGNGTFKLYAIADDADGHSTTLGSKTIVCANSTATAPFGAIDTPSQGGAVSGSAVANFGWVLSPNPRRADPPTGGTVQIVIDGAFISTVPSGWTSRSDLNALFPASQFPGIVNALGVAVLDSTSIANGVHTISWVVTDNLGSASGIGSRYFTISNSAGQALAPESSQLAEGASMDAGVEGRRGWDASAPFEALPVDAAGVPTMQAEELDRIELRVRARAGHLRSQIGNHRLPIGSRIDPADGTFSWLPGPGFVGIYEFVFDTPEGPRDVRVRLNPQGSLTRPQVVIDLPAAETSVGSAFTIAGWAFDPAGRSGTGISSLHVWAYPIRGGTPTFLGSATRGGRRPDVAAIYGDRFQDSGFGLVAAGLPSGTYDLAVFPWSDSAGRFLSATVVRIVVR